MTDEQITMLRNLIKDEIECAQIDGMEHGQWGWAEKQLDEGWKVFQESFNEEYVEDPWNLQPRQPMIPVKKPQQYPVEGFE